MTKRVYVCDTCGALAEEPGHLCNPKTEVEVCPYCSEKNPHRSHYCKGKMEDLKYVCDKCGRLSPNADVLCAPKNVPTM